jgi:hypothetical protein
MIIQIKFIVYQPKFENPNVKKVYESKQILFEEVNKKCIVFKTYYCFFDLMIKFFYIANGIH